MALLPTGEISFVTRARDLKNLETSTFDLLVLGGGINGAGVARDAALRGLSVVLVEEKDFAEGTSSRSSKLIHGGIRYLENLEFGLVFESLTERNRLFDLAPHLVHPLKFILPIYEGSRHPIWKLSLGMWLYDALSLFEAPELHQRWSQQELLAEVPYLEESGLKGGFSYYDAYTEDDRLVLETLRSAARTNRASLINHCRALPGIEKSNGLLQMQVQDTFSEAVHTVRARHVVSALGPWTDIFSSQLRPDWEPVLRPTKGVHLVFKKERFPLESAVVMNDDQRGRIVFALPRKDFVLLGTTDTDFASNPSEARTDSEDISYLLKMATEYFPRANLKKGDIVSCYAGVRPLFGEKSGSESKMSREHKIFSKDPGITFVTGGKFTTYRKMAAETVDEALKFFPLEKQVLYSRSLSESPLNPAVTPEKYNWARRQIEEWSKEFGLPRPEMKYLVERYGEECLGMLTDYDLPSKLSAPARVAQIEARWAIHHSGCMSVSDFLMRRTSHFLGDPDHGRALWDVVADCFVEEMGLTPEQIQGQLQDFESRLRSEFQSLSV